MGKFIVPNIFIAGTKAKAQEVNENFASIQEELEKKALKEGSENQTFYVANATEDGQAVSKNQMQTFVAETNNTTLAKACADKLSLFASSGNTDNEGNAELITFSDLELTFLVGNNYPTLKGNIQGENIEIKEIENFSLSGFANGKYNIFVNKNGEISVLSNNIYIQPKQPSLILNDVWVDTSSVPDKITQFDGSNKINFDKLLIGKVTIENSQITSVKTVPYNSKEVTVVNQNHNAHIIETYQNEHSWYRIWSDGFVEQGGIVLDMGVNCSRDVTLLKPYKNTNYSVIASFRTVYTGSWGNTMGVVPISNSLFRVAQGWYGDPIAVDIQWRTCGYTEF